VNRNRIDRALWIVLAAACAWAVTRVARRAGPGEQPVAAPESRAGDEVSVATRASPPAEGPIEPSPAPPVRIPLGDPPPGAPAVSGAPGVPLGAAALSVLRFPDRVPLSGASVRVLAPGGRLLCEAIVPPDGRLRLDDVLLSDPEPLRVRVADHEPAVVAARTSRAGIEYEALLRPTRGWLGRVVDGRGAPLAGVRVAGWWVESPRPFVNAVAPAVLAPDVARRLAETNEDGAAEDDAARESGAPATEPDAPAERGSPGAAAREEPPLQFIAAHATLEATAPTDEDGWYYLPPLGGYVLGRMTLYADTERGASSVLRVPLPDELGTRLPELVVPAARPLRGVVVDPDGFPVAGAAVTIELAEGWSRDWRLVTDEHGVFSFTGPSGALAVAVEKVGYRLAQPAQWKPASADGMWRALEELAGPARGPALFSEAYADWRAPLPRARGQVRVEAGHTDVRIVLEPLAPVAVDVFDAQEGFALVDAGVVARFGGLDPRLVATRTDYDGRAFVPAADREWQPSLIEVGAEGYVPATIALAPGELHGPIRVRLARVESLELGPLAGPPAPGGRVLGPDGAPRAARVAIYEVGGKRLWSGTSDREGRFPVDVVAKAPRVLRFFAATEGDEPTRGEAGPIASQDLRAGREVVLQLDPSAPCGVHVQNLEPIRPYRLEWSLFPLEGGPPLVGGSLALPVPQLGRVDATIPAHPGWHLEVRVLGGTVGSGPTMDLSEGEEERAYSSTRFTWTGWDVVARPWRGRVPFHGGRLFFRAERLIDLCGTAEGLPAGIEPGRVWVAALGCGGSWFAPVSPRGWFDLRDVPAGRFRLVLYERDECEHGGWLHDAGRTRGELEVESEWSRYDLSLVWGE